MADWIDEEKARRQRGENRPLLQSQHDAVNGHYPGTTMEECIDCGEHTGNAGRGDGSLYCDVCDKGPRCSGCHENHPHHGS